MNGFFGILIVLVPLLVAVLFVAVIGGLVVTVISNLSKPLLSRPARVIAKRGEVRGHHHHAHRVASTRYYVTFQFEGGSREEFAVSGAEFGLLVEGDQGTLDSRGSWYRGFHRA